MKLLLKKAIVADPNSPFDSQTVDIFIENGRILSIRSDIDTKTDKEIRAEGLMVSPGWVDVFAHFCDPGFEHRETLESGANAAAAGGYTDVFLLPNTKPVTDHKSQAEYIRRSSAALAANLHPLGAITRGIEGKDLAEMYDMRNSGAIAFTDGLNPVQSPGLFLKALQYVKAFNGVLIQLPIDKSIGAGGLINEGMVSTRLGLPGIPALAEEIIIKRDIDLLRYTGSKLHITGVSTAKGIALVAEAKKQGLQISCSVTPYHLFFCDSDMDRYDTHLKVNPPLRTAADREALQEAVVNGIVDCIASHHIPHDWDSKVCEFEYAKNGMTGLETAFAAVNHVLPGLPARRIAELFSLNPRNIFDLPLTNIAEGQPAVLSLFSKTGTTVLTKENTRSRSANSPYIGMELNGKVLGTFHQNKLFFNQN